MIAEMFRKVRQKSQQRIEDAFSAYWQNVVVPLAEGRELDPESVVAAAEPVGRDAETVEADVALYLRRQQMAEEYKQLPAIQKEVGQLEESIAKLNSELAAVQTRISKQLDAAIGRRNELSSRAGFASQIPTELVNTCPNPALKDRAAEILDRRKKAQEERRRFLGTPSQAVIDEQLAQLDREAETVRQQQLIP
jgi:hypothetical protein